MLESTIERYMVDRCRSEGVFLLKNTGMNGIPDRLMCKYGHHLWAELKAPGKKPTDLQQEVMRKLRRVGCICIVIDSKELVDRAIDAICTTGKKGIALMHDLENETKSRFPYKRE